MADTARCPDKPIKLTGALAGCLIAVHEAGSVVMMRGAGDVKFLAAGEFLRFNPGTFLRLIGAGLLEFSEPTRLRLTLQGQVEVLRFI